MRVNSRQATIYKFEFTPEELRQAGGLESEWIDYMERTARTYLSLEGFNSVGGDMSWDFSYDDRPSFLTLAI